MSGVFLAEQSVPGGSLKSCRVQLIADLRGLASDALCLCNNANMIRRQRSL